jgi:hypothetical protein
LRALLARTIRSARRISSTERCSHADVISTEWLGTVRE